MIAFGPVPSRRLGRSMEINNIPPKICTYACVYCQLGRTIKMQMERQSFHEPEEILQDVRDKVEKTRKAGEPIDYLTFVPDGEPALDINLGREIELMKQLGIKIAVITNSSLMWQEGVREVLAKADWASLKADAVRESIWRRIDRPHGTLQILSQRVGQVEYLIGYEGNAFAFTGDVEQDLLSITAVHPVREDAVDEFLARAQSKQGAEADWEVVRRLMARGQLVEVKYEGHRFYLRRLGRHKDRD